MKANSGKDTKAKAVNAKDAKAKVSAKPSAKAPAKPAAKPAVKVSAKVAAKPAAKAAPKAVAKPAAKPAAKAVKASKPVAKAPVKAVAKAPAKTVAKAAAKPVAKVAPKAAPKPAVKIKAPTPAASKPSPAKAAAVVAVAPVPVVPAKSGRPSSRLAQLTVPSMAQSVASTAAKATYTLTMSSPVIAPVIPSIAKKDAKLANNWKSKPVAELTDAELLAMPDSEYMNDVQLAAFRLKLSILKRDILNSAGETTEHLREDTSVVPDPADRATIEEEHALELRTRDRERKLLKKIEQSIVRIDAGDYGYCDETGEPIGVGRLLARPTATLSLEAQQRRELKQKMFGD
ncbi:RNA polymerase-binding protein DksA [Rhodoferax saidenbachensis]|uniref:RNA polymerase-binding transcription factor DksA n=1 Tax=Rhodoferax saidenbachensis TaxID=1484693 RepID=A0ABU1ZK79_9BURK|nr:RNA polymerase-binding protein DksA [Rhodoferax saidenbachensis]MDR7305962.1 DnaK suppressor protein [Rhodoferax saidenbachensis]